MVENQGLRALVLKGLGSGNIPDRFVPAVREITASGVPVVVSSACPDSRVDLNAYEVGQQAQDAGAFGAMDMTWDTIEAKLGIALSLAEDKPADERLAFVKDFFYTPLADECSAELLPALEPPREI